MKEKVLDYDVVILEFERYLSLFDLTNKDISGKKYHSYAVASLCGSLARDLSFTDDEIVLAKIIGLLHDIGRFPQLQETGSYNDKKMDHAEEGINYLCKSNMHIVDFIKDRNYDEIIRKSIYNHNKFSLPKEDNPVVLKFMKLIRDADKIEIFYRVSVGGELTFTSEVTEEVLSDYRLGKTIKIENCKTKGDSVLLMLAFLFDFNYEESFELLFETDHLGIFIGSVEVENGADLLWNEVRGIAYNKLEGGLVC